MPKKSRKLYNEVGQESLFDKCFFLGKYLHYWIWIFLIRSYGKDLKLPDLPKCPETDLSDELTINFEHFWNIELKNAKIKNKRPSLLIPIFKIFGVRFLFNAIFSLLPPIFLLIQALMIGSFIRKARELETNPGLKPSLWTTAFLMVLCHFIHCTSINIYNSRSLHYSIKMRIALSGLMYKKVLRLNKSAFLKTSPGQIVNLIANDINKLEMVLHFLPYPFICLIIICLGVGLLWNQFKYSVLIGVSVLFILIPIQICFGKQLTRFFAEAAKRTDERIRLMSEFLPAIKIIKMYCWETQFAKMIDSARKREVGKIRSGLYFYSLNLGLFYVTGKMVIFSCLVSYVLFGNSLRADQVFMAFAILDKISFSTALFIPRLIRQCANGYVSFNRIRTFLCLPETNENQHIELSPLFDNKSMVQFKDYLATYDSIQTNFKINNGFIKDEIIQFTNVHSNEKSTKNSEESTKNGKLFENSDYVLVLKNINLECRPGELITVVGPVGSGKSSILMAILDETNTVGGSIEVKGRISYSCQEAWTFAGTIKDNILFGSEYDEKKYKNVIRVCALERDMTLFPQGDQTIVGERGVALSGGQRARINLARALYYEADIYLLDDPLSAVDPHVAKHIFKEAITEYLNKKIVILVTHQLQFVKNSTKVLIIKEGQQLAFSDYRSLLSGLNKIELKEFLGVDLQSDQQQSTRSESNKFGSMVSLNSIKSEATYPIKSRSSISNVQADSEALEKLRKKQCEEEQKIQKRQIIKEITALQFSRRIYYVYLKLGLAGWLGPVLLAVFLLAQAIFNYSDYFLTLWITSEEKRHNEFVGGQNQTSFVDNLTQHQNIIIYSSLMLGLFLLSLMRALLFFKACLTSSVKLHDRLFRKVVTSPISFFETNPIGVLLNRVSRDTGIVDEILPLILFDGVDVAIVDISICLMIAILKIYLLIPFLILMVPVYFIRRLYLRTAKTVRMLESVAKSPVIQHISSSINGLTTIRAFKAQDRFNMNFNMLQNDHTSAYFLYIMAIRWFVYTLDTLQVIFIAGILFVVVQLSDYLDASTIGLIVSYTLLFCSQFQWMIKNWSEVETQIISVDRLDQYSSLPQEPSWKSTPHKTPPNDWPQHGTIEFRNVSMKYFEDEEPVLKNLSFRIESSQKIGVVGRTGAGKSSIIAALFRMYEYEGDILIDGINVKEIGLHELRKKLALIPQEPVLFTGTVRSNLDPLDEIKDDSILWSALKQVQLDKAIENMGEGLESKISDSGSNFSSGQKQLICLARAILRNNKILVLDEATANCDFETDKLIQKTIRIAFKEATLITVAHRLQTIIDSDKILVMDSGSSKEFDTPYNLLQDNSTIFSSMVNAQDKNMIDYLKKMAIIYKKDQDLIKSQ